MRDGFNERVLDDLITCDVLVLDDLGAEYLKQHGEEGWPQDQLYRLLNARNLAGAPVVITTNHSQRELHQRLGRRIADRLTEMCRWVEVPGESYRLRAGR